MAALEHLTFNNTFYNLGEGFYTGVTPQGLKAPHLISASKQVAQLIGLDEDALKNKSFVDIFSGNKILSTMQPLAMVYSGHQFGSYNPRLGDGRALLLGEVDGPQGRFDLNLKGAGQTPYSRFGDGRAVLRSSIREYLCSEAMAALGIPTTRALCLIGGEDQIARETMETSAIVCRVAPSHLRFGNFEWFFYQNDHVNLKKLANYVIEHHYPEVKDSKNKYAKFFEAVVIRTAEMIAYWQAVGFAHGVMNTDNMSILGLTFDYGPFGFLDDFEPGFICNHSDHGGRYAFNQQPEIGMWNLNALAHVLTPLAEKQSLIDALKTYEAVFLKKYIELLSNKMGLYERKDELKDKEDVGTADQMLIQDWLGLMAQNKVDYTHTFRHLCDVSLSSNENSVEEFFADKNSFQKWFVRYKDRLSQQDISDEQRQQQMKCVNPKYILRNYLVQQAIEKAQKEKDFSEVNNLLNALYKPFDEQPEMERYAEPPPDSGKHLEISCSS